MSKQDTPKKKPVKKLSFKQKMMQHREELIIDTVNHLLATKGYDAMTVDEIADTVGIAKASLYRHFSGKDALAIGALIFIMEKAMAEIEHIDAQDISALNKIIQITRWTMTLKLNHKMPNLPSENSQLREKILINEHYMDLMINISDAIGAWIEKAQEVGELTTEVEPICILYTLYARACDPVLGFLKQSGMFDDEQILDMVTLTCFNGIKNHGK